MVLGGHLVFPPLLMFSIPSDLVLPSLHEIDLTLSILVFDSLFLGGGEGRGKLRISPRN